MEGDPQNFRPPVLVGERVAWLGSGSGLPQPATVRWIGRIPEITTGWTVGIELDRAMPVGGIDGTWRKRILFSCEPKRGLLVPIDKIMKESSLLKTRHSLSENFYDEGTKPISKQSEAIIRKLSLPQSSTSQEFLARVLPPSDRKPKHRDPPEVALNFKTAVSQINGGKPEESKIIKPLSPVAVAKPAPLTIANVRTLDSLGRGGGLSVESRIPCVPSVRQQTLDELEKFKKHLDELEKLKNVEHSSKSRRRKIGKNPESLYDLAKPAPEVEESLFLRIIGEKKELVVEAPKRKLSRREDLINEIRIDHGEQFTRRETVRTVIPEEQNEIERTTKRDSEQNTVNKVVTVRDKDQKEQEKKIREEELRIQEEREQKLKYEQEQRIKKEQLELKAQQQRIKAEQEEKIKKDQKLKLEQEQKLKEEQEEKIKKEQKRKHEEELRLKEERNQKLRKEEELRLKKEQEQKLKKDQEDKIKEQERLRKEKEQKIKEQLVIKEALTSLIPESETSVALEVPKTEDCLAEEKLEEEFITESFVASSVEVQTSVVDEESESVSHPTPTIRKRRQQGPPVPSPRRRSSDARALREDGDTSGVLYEPAFLRAYLDAEATGTMSDVRGTFRRIDEDELDRRGPPCPPARRLLSGTVSAPGGAKKGIFSFFKWFRKSKPRDLDLEAFNAPSVASSPLFTRSRLANAESVDTLYSIATVSSFAFVSGAQYQSALGSDRRKKRRAPLPPTPPQRRDVSLPNTLEGRARQLHRRSASESYKDRRSGAFAHVHGKRRAPAPPVPPPRDLLYPSLSSVRNGSLPKKKRPAPLPPEPAVEEATAGAEVVESDTSADLVTENNVSEPQNTEPAAAEMAATNREDGVMCNDTLRLERGVLKPNKALPPSPIPPDVAKVAPTSPVSPRPWYKRKSLEKRKEKISEEWMPEVGIARPPVSPEASPLKFNFFSRNEDKKRDEKRKSGLSMLANISELDREAAEICRKEQVHQQQLLDAGDAKFYGDGGADAAEADVPKRNSTRELISLFNSIGHVTRITVNPSVLPRQDSGPQSEPAHPAQGDLPLAVCSKPDIRTAAVVGTREFVSEEVRVVEPQVVKVEPTLVPPRLMPVYDHRGRRQHSPSPVSTIDEISEPSSSAATLNQYQEPVWTCTRCTLENLQWKNRCDACSACKPSYNPAKKQSDKRKSEMELEIDWERELQKYFPVKASPPKEEEVSAKLTLSKTGDVLIKTETKKGNDPKEGDLDELRRKRLAFFVKSLGNEAMTSLRDAAAKKSLDEAEKSKLKGMLKEMKDSLPKYEAVKNNHRNVNATGSRRGSLPDGAVNRIDPGEVVNGPKSLEDEAAKYGAIKKIRKEDCKPAEALLVTTTTVLEDIIVRKKPSETKNVRKEPVVSVPIHRFSTVGMKNGEPYTSLKKARRLGDGPFELMRARDLANIIESKTGNAYPAHVYANYPQASDVSDASSNGREVARLATQLTRASGVAEFRAALDPSAADTLAVNRLLRRLEAAIAAGRHDQAATLARELAGLKVNCYVTRSRPSPSPPPATITVEMYVEDKVSHQGPIPLRVTRSMTVADLKVKVQDDLQIPAHVQRWILGKQLATEDFRTLEDLGVTQDRCPIFLYLVAPEPEAPERNITPSAPEKEEANAEEAAKATAQPPLGKGWYYNYEEDRYSYCDSESEDSPEREVPVAGKAAAVRVIQRTIENARSQSKSASPPVANGVVENERKNEDLVLQPAPQAKPFSPLQQRRPPLQTSVSLPEKPAEVTPQQSNGNSSREPNQATKSQENDLGEKSNEMRDKSGDARGRSSEIDKSRESEKRDNPRESERGDKSQSMPPEKAGESSETRPRQRSRSIFDLIKPQSNDTLKKDLKVISVNAVKETIEKLNRRAEDLQRNGWRCAVCTLVNAAARPGCAACAAERPPGYAPLPTPTPVEQELKRLRRDQSLDLPLFKEPDENDQDKQHYLELVNLDSADCVVNTEVFDCPVCLTGQAVGEGVVLRECLHTFCRGCLAQTVEFNEEAEVKCPYRDANYSCESVLQQREIKALVPRTVFEQHLARSVAQAERRMGNAFHCKTPDCQGWCVLDDNVNEFRCPVCSHVNCLTCQAIHEGLNCRAYQDRLRSSSDTNAEARRTRSMLEDMVQRGDAMACPTCQVVLMKKWGCDWLRCSMCKTEICWVTRGPRWGPAGKGDTSAGCQCGVNGVKCHPKCNYCH